jgi:hypothetical protein
MAAPRSANEPKLHLTRYHGVLAPHSALRAQVTPAGRGKKTGVSERSPAERHRAMTIIREAKKQGVTMVDADFVRQVNAKRRA